MWSVARSSGLVASVVLVMAMAACSGEAEPDLDATGILASSDEADDSSAADGQADDTTPPPAGPADEAADQPGLLQVNVAGGAADPVDPPAGNDGDQPPAKPAADGQADLGDPDDVVAEMEATLEAQSVAGAELLDAIGPLDDEPTSAEIQGMRQRREAGSDPAGSGPTNEAGELDRLDEPAALACSDVERALTAIDEGSAKTAVEEIGSASTRAGKSAVSDIAAWSNPLGAWTGIEDDPAVLVGFLSSCTKAGYEL